MFYILLSQNTNFVAFFSAFAFTVHFASHCMQLYMNKHVLDLLLQKIFTVYT